MMTIVRSLGVTTLVALMSAARADSESCEPLDPVLVEGAGTHGSVVTEDRDRQPATEPRPSYS
jgi:hypothetical protein